MAKKRVLVLGAGFGGMELSTILSEHFGEKIEIVLIDKSDHFYFGYSKLDVMFGRAEPEGVKLPYRNFTKPGVRLVQETVLAIDPANRAVVTDGGRHDGDYLIVALGADYDFAATPGLAEAGEFYSMAGAIRLRDRLAQFKGGGAVIGVCGAPFKCPPAPSECALMLHDTLLQRGLREASEITLVIPFGVPIPPSPETSKALIGEFAERAIRFVPQRRVAALKPGGAVLDNGSELACDIFFGIPKHRAPDVVEKSGLTDQGWVTVEPRSLKTKFANVFAIGDIANTGTPKAGLFAEGAAQAVARTLIAEIEGGDGGLYAGRGTCYLEFGGGRIGRVDVDFFSGPSPTGVYHAPSVELRAGKEEFGRSRRDRWFAMP